MMRNVPVQSLIDHIKTAVDVDPWAKEMVETMLKKQEVKNAIVINSLGGRCPKCEKTISRAWECCPYCCQRVKWE